MKIGDHEVDDLRRLADRVEAVLADSARCERLDEGDAVEVLTDVRDTLTRLARPPIVICVRGGVVQGVDQIPADVSVEVRDYDVDGDGQAGDRDDDGNACEITRYLSDGVGIERAGSQQRSHGDQMK